MNRSTGFSPFGRNRIAATLTLLALGAPIGIKRTRSQVTFPFGAFQIHSWI